MIQVVSLPSPSMFYFHLTLSSDFRLMFACQSSSFTCWPPCCFGVGNPDRHFGATDSVSAFGHCQGKRACPHVRMTKEFCCFS